jgi:hypothetical protein
MNSIKREGDIHIDDNKRNNKDNGNNNTSSGSSNNYHNNNNSNNNNNNNNSKGNKSSVISTITTAITNPIHTTPHPSHHSHPIHTDSYETYSRMESNIYSPKQQQMKTINNINDKRINDDDYYSMKFSQSPTSNRNNKNFTKSEDKGKSLFHDGNEVRYAIH